jgi:hypothetical protein
MERKTLKNVLSKMDFDIVESPKKTTVKRNSTVKKPRTPTPPNDVKKSRTPTPPNDAKKSRTPSVSRSSSKINNTKKSRTP